MERLYVLIVKYLRSDHKFGLPLLWEKDEVTLLKKINPHYLYLKKICLASVNLMYAWANKRAYAHGIALYLVEQFVFRLSTCVDSLKLNARSVTARLVF